MTDHVHGWAIIGKWANCVAQWNCPAGLSPEEIDRRLNATERLSANMAKALCRGMHPNFKAAIKALTTYADILEGKDE